MLLLARHISKRFDATQALLDAGLSIEPGEVVALVGENGAGKSTLSKILAGVLQPDAGELIWNGAPVTLRNPVEAQRLGIGIIFQELDLFPNLTVAGNLMIGNVHADRGFWLRHGRRDAFCRPLLDEVGLDVPVDRPVAELSLAQMQLVSIARALGMNARLLIMDEPTSALGEENAETLFRLIARLKHKGVAILYVSHKMDEIFRLADRITVLRDGRHAGAVAARDIGRQGLISLMVGREIAETAPPPPATPGPVLLRVNRLASRKLQGIAFDLRAGEVLGVAGLVGSGRSSLGAALFGLDPSAAAAIELRGQPYTPRSPRHAIRSGIGLLPEDRKTMGLLMQSSIEENATLAVLDRLQSFGFYRQAEARAGTASVCRTLRVKATSPGSPIDVLSGGNQQKVLLGRWLWAGPDILILDDPTRGIDVGAKYDIYEVIRSLAAQGKGIILISSELPELLQLSDRILVLHEGRQVAILPRGEATQERIMAFATRSGPDSRPLPS